MSHAWLRSRMCDALGLRSSAQAAGDPAEISVVPEDVESAPELRSIGLSMQLAQLCEGEELGSG